MPGESLGSPTSRLDPVLTSSKSNISPKLQKYEITLFIRDEYKNHPLLTYRRQAEKQKEIQEIIKKQAVR